jgi:hypothetical protein
MRILALVPATCLALFAPAALAQQPAPQPNPPPGPAEPAPQQGAAPTPTESPWGMERRMPVGTHHPGMDLAPTLHLRYGDLVLDLPCSARDDTAACANVALGIV